MYILVVDDDVTSRCLLMELLDDLGEVEEATSGRDALARVERAYRNGQFYDLICLDIEMPDMDGLEALRKLRAMEDSWGMLPGRGAAVVMTTAHCDAPHMVGAFRARCEAYLVKPIHIEQLYEVLERVGVVAAA